MFPQSKCHLPILDAMPYIQAENFTRSGGQPVLVVHYYHHFMDLQDVPGRLLSGTQQHPPGRSIFRMLPRLPELQQVYSMGLLWRMYSKVSLTKIGLPVYPGRIRI